MRKEVCAGNKLTHSEIDYTGEEQSTCHSSDSWCGADKLLRAKMTQILL